MTQNNKSSVLQLIQKPTYWQSYYRYFNVTSKEKYLKLRKRNSFLLNQILRNPVEGISFGFYLKAKEFIIILKSVHDWELTVLC